MASNILVLPSAAPATSGSNTLVLPRRTAGTALLPVRTPQWVLIYRGKNITADVSKMIIDLTYTDNIAHLSDQLEITLEDRDRRWQGPWFPANGDPVSLQIGYLNEGLLNCGDFQVDEIELKGPPDQVSLKCIAAGTTVSIRTPRSRGYENQSLLQIAQTVAAAHNMTVTGAPEINNVTFGFVGQAQETDLQFLHRISEAHNYDFAIRGQAGSAVRQMIFYSRTKLEAQPIVASLVRGKDSIKTFEFKTKTERNYQASTVAYQDARTKTLIGSTSTDPTKPTADELHIVARCETPQQAALKSFAALHTANMANITTTLEVEGTTLLVAGSNISITGFGNTFSGKYHIEKSQHKLSRDTGYVTEISCRHL